MSMSTRGFGGIDKDERGRWGKGRTYVVVRALLLERLLREHVARPEQHERRRALGHQRSPDERRATTTNLS